MKRKVEGKFRLSVNKLEGFHNVVQELVERHGRFRLLRPAGFWGLEHAELPQIAAPLARVALIFRVEPPEVGSHGSEHLIRGFQVKALQWCPGSNNLEKKKRKQKTISQGQPSVKGKMGVPANTQRGSLDFQDHTPAVLMQGSEPADRRRQRLRQSAEISPDSGTG